MSEYLIPVTFEGQHIAPSDDGAAWASGLTDGILSGCALTKSGASLTIAAGKIVAAGRVARVDNARTFALASSGYDRLVLTIDLSKTAAEQVALDIQHSSSQAFPALTQDDINNGGTKYQTEICMVSSTTILWEVGRAHSKGYGYQVTLQASAWRNNQYIIWANGVLSGTNVIVTPDPSSQAVCDACEIYAQAQTDRTITFRCTTVPSTDVKFNILLY